MTEITPETKTESTAAKPLILVGLGCLVILVVIGLGVTVAMKFVAKKAGVSLLENVIEKKTGVNTDLSDLEKGKMTFTDNKTGQTVDIGSGEIPQSFPKDFPVYQGAKVTGSLSGGQAGEGNGFWLTLSTTDATNKVVDFYKEALKINGWEVQSTMAVDGATTYTVTKGKMSGSVSVSKGGDNEQAGTSIVIALGENTSGD